MLRDIQLSQNALMDMTKNNSREILRISNPFHPSVFRDTLASLEDRKAEEERKREQEEERKREQEEEKKLQEEEKKLREEHRRERKEMLERSKKRLKELRQRNSENPATSSQSAGVGGSVSYEALQEEQKKDFRQLSNKSFEQTLNEYIKKDDLKGIKEFVSKHGGNSGYNAIRKMDTMIKKIQGDDELRRNYRGTYIRQNPSTRGYMETPPLSPLLQASASQEPDLGELPLLSSDGAGGNMFGGDSY
jgi:hypothetical protein